ncbi:aminodeoxychorismate lyase [Alteromonas sp. A079]|uniref:aminodeoxychorismate lyase n=1 Tax=Alteromonas sp. A079 TaxID=3410268 RepID=UPI003BA36716
MDIVSNSHPIMPDDRAFNYGDGVFTTMCVSDGHVELLPYHLRRLTHDTNVLGITIDIPKLSDAIEHVVAKEAAKTANSRRYVLKVHASAGTGGRGYARDPHAHSIVRLTFHPYPASYEGMWSSGITAMCANTRLAVQPLLAGVKHMNRLEQVFIKQEIARTPGVQDALVFDTQGNVIESSAGNVFINRNNTWYTPRIDEAGVNGVVRQCLLEHMRASAASVVESRLSLSDIQSADAIAITNAVLGVMWVSTLSVPPNPASLDKEDIVTFSNGQHLCNTLRAVFKQYIDSGKQ